MDALGWTDKDGVVVGRTRTCEPISEGLFLHVLSNDDII